VYFNLGLENVIVPLSSSSLHVRAVLDIAPGPSWSYDSGSQASYAAATSFLFQKAYFAS
jgi:hypothetical protein